MFVADYNKNLSVNPLNANPTKWSNTIKQFVGYYLSVFIQFVGFALKGLTTP